MKRQRLTWLLESLAFQACAAVRCYLPGSPRNRRLWGCCTCARRPAAVEYWGALDADLTALLKGWGGVIPAARVRDLLTRESDWQACSSCHSTSHSAMTARPWRPIPYPYRPVVLAEVTR